MDVTYLGFLLCFVVLPTLLLGLLAWRDRGTSLPATLLGLSPWVVLLVLVIVALVYTTPWDNYLVASRVWWYDPGLVTGITLGWVPLEEYVFVALQPIMIGLWLLWLARRLPVKPLTH